MEACDALIVGGGPAGSSCAWQLRRQGMDVMVLDKAEFPRHKVCAGWITPAVLRTLQIDPEAYAQEHTLQAISGFRTGLIAGPELATEYAGTVSYGIRRCEFDDYLLRRAAPRLRLGQALQTMRRDGSHWVINEAIATPLLIGAGGHFCPVARALGARAGGQVNGRVGMKVGAGETAVAAQEVEFEMNAAQLAACPVQPEMPELYFCPDLNGYGWIFRKGSYLNIGLGMEHAQRLPGALQDFCALLRQRGRIPPDTPTRFQGHAYLLHGRSRRRLVDDSVLLIGDAAGLAYAQSGEGIRPAVESGLLAATTAIEAAGDYRRQQLASYGERLRQRFGPEQNDSAGSPVLRRLLARLLLRSHWFARHVLLDRWFLHAGETDLQGI